MPKGLQQTQEERIERGRLDRHLAVEAETRPRPICCHVPAHVIGLPYSKRTEADQQGDDFVRKRLVTALEPAIPAFARFQLVREARLFSPMQRERLLHKLQDCRPGSSEGSCP